MAVAPSREPLRQVSSIGAARQSSDGPGRRQDFEPHALSDRERHRARQLQLAAGRRGHGAAGIENPRIEAPAVHAHACTRSEPFHVFRGRLFHDPRQVPIGVLLDQGKRAHAVCRHVAGAHEILGVESQEPGSPRSRSAETSRTGYRLSPFITRNGSSPIHRSAASTASAVPRGVGLHDEVDAHAPGGRSRSGAGARRGPERRRSRPGRGRHRRPPRGRSRERAGHDRHHRLVAGVRGAVLVIGEDDRRDRSTASACRGRGRG